MQNQAVASTSYLSRIAEQIDRLDAAGVSPDVLLVTCTDPTLDASIVRAAAERSFLVLRVPGCVLGGPLDERHDALDAVAFALLRSPIRRVVLCGHSMCGSHPTELPGPVKGSFPGIGAGALRQQLRVEAAKADLVRQSESLAQYGPVARRLREKTLELDCVLFREETATAVELELESDSEAVETREPAVVH